MISPPSGDSLCSDYVSKKKTSKKVITSFLHKEKKTSALKSKPNRLWSSWMWSKQFAPNECFEQPPKKKRVECPFQKHSFATFQKRPKKKSQNSPNPNKFNGTGPQPQLYILWFFEDFLGVLWLAPSFYERKIPAIPGSNHYHSPNVIG